MEKKLNDDQLKEVVGGSDDTPRTDENIHPGDRFQHYIQVWEVIRFVKRDSNRNYDVFECKYWDSYGAFMNGWEPHSIGNYYRVQLEAKERI